jgi:outer membrane protein assembly factor BamD (BamD/ComL family)
MESAKSIRAKNLTSTWRNCIFFTEEYPKKENVEYILYPTGSCDLSGRKYVAIPNDVKIVSNQLKEKYYILH